MNLVEILTERNKNVYYEYFKINERKFFHRRILIALALAFLYIALFIYTTKSVIYLAGIPIAMLIGFKIPYYELISKKTKSDIIKQYMFPTFLRYFISLIDTQGNVYQTLRATVPYVSEPIKSELEKLIQKLDEKNINNRDAFMTFAEFIGSSEAHMIMGMIYQMNEEGINKNDLQELETTITQLQENKTNELIEYKVMKIDKHANPILVYALVYILAFTILVQIAYFKTLL
ncbi:flagellar assembly protein FlaJ [Caldifermentibacillus hisashii]|uniref:flagellar assembly protein FlaJ n=1 Tax=Caldifermentibacillus hisashii TaxID=996558 RepID=UPI0030E82E4F